jgi:competence protein ComEA
MKRIVTILASCLIAFAAWATQAVNINKASAEQMSEALKGVGLSKAQAIVAYRNANGAFKHADELVNVKGIGLRTVDRNRGNILVEDRAPSGKKDD